MNNETINQHLENHQNPPKFLAIEELLKMTGVEYFEVSLICKFKLCLIAFIFHS